MTCPPPPTKAKWQAAIKRLFAKLAAPVTHTILSHQHAAFQALEERLSQIETHLAQTENSLVQTTNACSLKTETDLLQTLDARIWKAETNLLETMDARIWKAETNLLETMDARVWKAESHTIEACNSHMRDVEKEMTAYLRKYIPRVQLHRISVHLTEHCNLNCQCCDNFSPIARPEFADLARLDQDFARLSRLSHAQIHTIELMGGEPLLHPQICDFLTMGRAHFPHSEIHILTNGILLPKMPPSFWQACHDTQTHVVITKYPIHINTAKIQEMAQAHQVGWRFYEDCEIKTTYHLPLDLTGSQEERENFLHCFHANECVCLEKGRLYTCSVAAYIHHFNQYFDCRLPDIPENSISLYETNDMAEILSFLANPIPMCKYCMVSKRQYQLPWAVSQKKIEEYT